MRKSENAKLTTNKLEGVFRLCQDRLIKYNNGFIYHKHEVKTLLHGIEENAYLGRGEDVDDHSISNDRDKSKNTDRETQKPVPQGIHRRELVPEN